MKHVPLLARRLALILPVGSALMASCGDGGGTTAAPPPTGNPAAVASQSTAEGIWTGTTSSGSLASLVVLEHGETWGITQLGGDPVEALQGSTMGTSSSVTGNVTDFDLRTGAITPLDMTGTVAQRSTLIVVASNQSRSTSLNLAYNPQYDRPVSSADLAGMYVLGGRTMATARIELVTIDASGNLAFADNGCAAAGTVVPRSTGKSIFNLNATFTGASCVLGNGASISGVGFLDTTASPPQLSFFALRTDRRDLLLATGTKVQTSGSPPPSQPPAPPTPPPAPGLAGSTAVTGSIVAVPNTAYSVNSSSAGPITITLPATSALAVGDAVTITGTSATEWQAAQNTGQSILTHNLAGGVSSGTTWTAPTVGPQVWHWISSNATGDVLVAGEAAEGAQAGRLRVSTDAGATWTTPNLPAGVWISSDLSADGTRIVAVQFQGGMYLSADRGATWTQVTDPRVNLAAGLKFESVTMSRDGMRLAATVRDASDTQAGPAVGDGFLLLSNDGGATWSRATLPATTQPKVMRAVDSSADGQVIVAVSRGGDVFRSTDAGATFTLLPVAVGVPPVAASENWYRIKTSADGKTIAVAANSIESSGPGSGVYVSRDGGATWTKGLSRTGDYTAIAMSDDGATIAATISNPNPNNTDTTPGQVVRSTDGGATFQPLTMPAGTTDWRAIAMSFEGDRLAVASGFYLTREAGPLYLSSGSRTTVGTAGGIGGGNAGATLQVRYLGFNTFAISQATGTFHPK